jgi:microcystin degradation protein MlrC
MKFVIARFQHETNSFSPIATNMECFRGQWGNDAFLEQKGVNTAMGAFLDLAAELEAEVATPFAGFANPSGV